MSRKDLFTILSILFFSQEALCQIPQKNFNPDSLPAGYIAGLRKEYGTNKQYPLQFEKQILIALSYYPELKNTPIKFRTRTRHTPMLTRATWGGLPERKNRRHYVVTISTRTEPMLMPLLFGNLPFNAQVGVIGHELAHIANFAVMSFLEIIRHGMSSLSRKYLDRFEYNTDAICIAHGLGYQLLEWSIFVRTTMNRTNWGGPDKVHRHVTHERYMNPETIRSAIEMDHFYLAAQ